RDGSVVSIPASAVVPGDVMLLEAGDSVPGDGLILESRDLFVDEATLTGETFPAEKSFGALPSGTELARRTNALWKGTHVVSGTAKALVVATGRDTEFGKIYDRLVLRPPEAGFERGVRRFGYFLMEVTLILVIAIFAFNVYLRRPVLDSFLFSLALAVGLTPQLLPAIISVNLSHGARRMAASKVIVRRLASIEDFGSMNVLCSDKTGTLTEGVMHLHSAIDAEGNESEKVLFYAYLNATYETGYVNPIDEAIRSHRAFDLAGWRKLDEIPYDFVRKRLSIVAEKDARRIIVTKGALAAVLDVCSLAESSAAGIVEMDAVRPKIERRFHELSEQGLRMLGVAYKDAGGATRIEKSDESAMIFTGLLVFFDNPKEGIAETIGKLEELGVSLKIITGDNRLIAANVAKQLGVPDPVMLTGRGLREMSDGALLNLASDVDVFAEVEPNQKERIIGALKKAGNVVGFMGDGINDAPALRAADVGISVESAVDVAKEAADIVLLEKDLHVLLDGVREGRATFANTLKYVFMATSANFGNMFSMAGASLILPFLPLLPKQILLMNLMTDIPEMTIATDFVDRELMERPRRWDIKFIRRFMLTFGLVSSIFDFLTFGLLMFVMHASAAQFRTGWFLESVVSATLIVLVIRTRKPFFASRPGAQLSLATLLVIAATLALPFTPLARLFGFEPLGATFVLLLAGVVALYVASAEIAKRIFYRFES
ncbi:MAG: magnesium-translocating P-type ATPase, partial [Candidatus Krumholzibacteria bacterium]|nr:magnesium-translocating P-type ATPase [Candidatus Krumholzibacteria bacterium]